MGEQESTTLPLIFSFQLLVALPPWRWQQFGCFYKFRMLFPAPWPWSFLQLALFLGGSRAVTEAFAEVHRQNGVTVSGKAWPLWCCFLCRSCLDPGLLRMHRETEPGRSRTCDHPNHQQQSRELNLLTWVPCLYTESLQILSNSHWKRPWCLTWRHETLLIVCMCWGLVPDTNSVLPITFLALTRGLKWDCGI